MALALRSGSVPGPDCLDKCTAFVGQRDGLDKVLKLLQYTAKLVLSTTDGDSEALVRLKNFAKSAGVSRKAFRLGKFLGDVQKMRSQPPLTTKLGVLEGVGNASNCIYYFTEQFVWLFKTGFLKDEAWNWRAGRISVHAEMLALLASMTVSTLRLWSLWEREIALATELWRRKKEGLGDGEEGSIADELEALRTRRRLRVIDMLQDFMDALIAANDIRGGNGRVAGHPTVLAIAGLVSASISANKTWAKLR